MHPFDDRHLYLLISKYEQFDIITYELLDTMLSGMLVEESTMAYNPSMRLDNMINHYLCKQIIENDDADIVILLENQYHNVFKMILRKLGVPNAELDNVLDELLLEYAYAYDGRDSFTLSFIKFAREYLKKKIDKDEKTKEIVTLDTIMPSLSKLDNIDVITDMQYIGNQLKIIDDISLDDLQYIKFIVYYYGFLGYYASPLAICQSLNLTHEQYAKYLEDSYDLINQKLKAALATLTEDQVYFQKKI